MRTVPRFCAVCEACVCVGIGGGAREGGAQEGDDGDRGGCRVRPAVVVVEMCIRFVYCVHAGPPPTHTHSRARTHTHAHTHTHARTQTHKHTLSRARTCTTSVFGVYSQDSARSSSGSPARLIAGTSMRLKYLGTTRRGGKNSARPPQQEPYYHHADDDKSRCTQQTLKSRCGGKFPVACTYGHSNTLDTHTHTHIHASLYCRSKRAAHFLFVVRSTTCCFSPSTSRTYTSWTERQVLHRRTLTQA